MSPFTGKFTGKFAGAGGPDGEAPTITSFVIPANHNGLTVPITAFLATDNVGVTGYRVSESDVTPDPEDAGWKETPQASYAFASEGAKTLYAFAKDDADNISDYASGSVTITLPATIGMYGYLPAAVADYDYSLSIDPDSIPGKGGKGVNIMAAEDGLSERRIVLSSQSDFMIYPLWSMVTEAEADTIFDLYHDPAKANRTTRSFKLLHPRDGGVYVVKFAGPLPRNFSPAGIRSFARLPLQVLGYAS